LALSDVITETDALEDAVSEIEFQERLKELSELPKWKKRELMREMSVAFSPDEESGQGGGSDVPMGHLKIWNRRVRVRNKLLESTALCVKCRTWTERKNGHEENGLFYCGYCHAVCFSQKDTRWIPGKKE
jgi:hypothetical protein